MQRIGSASLHRKSTKILASDANLDRKAALEEAGFKLVKRTGGSLAYFASFAKF